MRLLAPLALLAACGLSSGVHAQTHDRQEIFTEDGVNAAAQGVWHWPLGGWLLEINETGIQRWQDTPAGCYPSATDGPTLMGQVEYRYITPDSQSGTARFEYLPGDGYAEFEQLDHLPGHCSFETDTSPTAVFETFAAIFQAHYAHFERRGVDWPSIVAEAQPLIRDEMSDDELFNVLAGMMTPLGDSHTKLIAEIDGERRRAQFGLGDTLPRIDAAQGETPWLIGILQQLFTQLLDPGASHIANDRVITGTIENRVGYIQFLTMGGFTTGHTAGTPAWAEAELSTLESLLDEQLTAFAGMEAVILDLSNNRGGYDAICHAIAARFTDETLIGYEVDAVLDGEVHSAKTQLIHPHNGPRFSGPVYVLTSDVTVSCGEITTLILRQHPHVIQIGARTRGAFSTPLAKPLPNGWYLELSNEIYRSAAGETYEARGLTPDIEIHPFPEDAPVGGHARAIEAVLADLDSR